MGCNPALHAVYCVGFVFTPFPRLVTPRTASLIAAIMHAAHWPCHNAAIAACEKGAQPGSALELFQARQKKWRMPNVITYNAAISACEKGTQPGSSLELFEAMQKKWQTPNGVTYNAASSHARRALG